MSERAWTRDDNEAGKASTKTSPAISMLDAFRGVPLFSARRRLFRDIHTENTPPIARFVGASLPLLCRSSPLTSPRKLRL